MTLPTSGASAEPQIGSGALLFGRYAFPPNRLGYCGPDDHRALFEYVSSGTTDGGLLELERRFDGAYPYLRLIAQANGISDPFDGRVVEAYWIGNTYLERVAASPFYESLKARFGNRMNAREFTWLSSELEHGARPHHNFHVFDVYRRAGLTRDRGASIALDRMESCRISWGEVIAAEGAVLVVRRAAIALVDDKLSLSEPRVIRVARQIDGRGFADGAKVGDTVSIHWDWVCEVLTPSKLERLQRNTQRAMAQANTTL